MMNYKELFISFLLCVSSFLVQGQLVHTNYPLNKWSGHFLDQELVSHDSLPLSAVKPYIISAAQLYTLPGFKKDTGKYYFNATHKLYGDNLVVIDKEDFFFTIDLILNLDIAKEFRDPSQYADTSKFFLNTRGFFVRGSIGKKLSFETFFSENQLFVPLYQREYMLRFSVTPGATRHKPFQGVGFDLGYAGGHISYQALPNWNMQFGHGKHFVGEGYRSVILSDNSPTYPYLRSSLQLFKGKLEFTNLFASMQNLIRLPFGNSPESLFERKAFSMNTISFSPIKQIRLGFSEVVMWQSFVHLEGDKDFDPRWINPLPFYNSVALNWNENDNLFIGVDLALKPFDQVTLYGQYMIDDAHTDRTSYQLGLKTTDLFVKDLFLRAEYNESEHYTGAHDLSLQSLTHTNQPIAHPLGSGFKELILQVAYKYKRWFTDVSHQSVQHDKDVIMRSGNYSNFGVNLLETYPNELPLPSQLDLVDLNSTKIRVGYLFNQFNNFMAFFSLQRRHQNGVLFPKEKNALISFGIKTELFNHYYDF